VGSLFQILNNLIESFTLFLWQIKSVHSKFYISLVVEKESVSILSYELASANCLQGHFHSFGLPVRETLDLCTDKPMRLNLSNI
jgi:hypothetical protein